MPPASESNGAALKVEAAKAEAKNAIIGWLVGVVTSISLIVAGYSMNGVSKLETRTAVTESNFTAMQKSIDEIKNLQKDDTKETRREQQRMNEKIDRISEAVGAKRP